MKALAIFNTTRIYGAFYHDEPGVKDNSSPDAKEEEEYQALLSRAASNCLTVKTKKRLLELTEKRRG